MKHLPLATAHHPLSVVAVGKTGSHPGHRLVCRYNVFWAWSDDLYGTDEL